MNNLSMLVKTFFLLLLINFIFCSQKLHSQTKSPTQIEWKTLGSENQIEYIDVSKLKSDTKQSTSEFPISLDWDQKSVEIKSFYRNEEIHNTSCEGKTALRKNVIHYCLPFADIGYHIPEQAGHLVGEFTSMHGYGLDVYYEADKNRFYFFSCCWNYSEGFGPFLGNPKFEIPKAIKPRRKHDLKLKFQTEILQRWLYPNADEEVEITEKEIPCATSSFCLTQRELQYQRLNTYSTKILITNSGAGDLYYIVPKSGNVLSKAISSKYFYRQQGLEKRVEPEFGQTWKSFPRGKTIEIEFESIGRDVKADTVFLVYFNDKPTSWDGVEYQIKFDVKFRTFKAKNL